MNIVGSASTDMPSLIDTCRAMPDPTLAGKLLPGRFHQLFPGYPRFNGSSGAVIASYGCYIFQAAIKLANRVRQQHQDNPFISITSPPYRLFTTELRRRFQESFHAFLLILGREQEPYFSAHGNSRPVDAHSVIYTFLAAFIATRFGSQTESQSLGLIHQAIGELPGSPILFEAVWASMFLPVKTIYLPILAHYPCQALVPRLLV